MKERGDVIVLGLAPIKLTFIFINLICLTLIMMWASEDHMDSAFLSSSLPQTQLPLSLSPLPDVSRGSPMTPTNSSSKPLRVGNNIMPINASARTEKFDGNKGKVLDMEVPFGTIKVSQEISHKGCNYGIGKWVEDERRPLYSGANCNKWLSKTWSCRSSQRVDFAFEKFRWQPRDCQLEEFHASKFLQRMRDKTLAFIGDSLGRQQFQSLMCMIVGNEARPYILDVGKEYNLVKTHKKSRPSGWAYRFPSSNTTILFYWSPCLCDLVRLRRSKIAMHLDKPPAFLRNFLPRLDALVLNTGHHWTPSKLHSNRWVIHVGGVPNPSIDIKSARNFTIHNIINWVDSKIPQQQPNLKAFYRTISPRHFSNGEWYNGGRCDNIIPFLSRKNEVQKYESSDAIAAKAVEGTRVRLLDITALSELRDEGHVSKYGVRARHGIHDCLHWCLPGIPDAWNEILVAQL